MSGLGLQGFGVKETETANIGAAIIRTGFRGMSYGSYIKEPPQ